MLGKLQDKAVAVRTVMQKIARLPQKPRADMLEKLAILAGLRPTELPALLKKEQNMPISIDLEKNPLFMEIFERYTKEGEQRGIQIGERHRSITLLRLQLEKRFGALPLWVNTRLEQATLQELEQWSLQIFDTTQVEEVFGDFK